MYPSELNDRRLLEFTPNNESFKGPRRRSEPEASEHTMEHATWRKSLLKLEAAVRVAKEAATRKAKSMLNPLKIVIVSHSRSETA